VGERVVVENSRKVTRNQKPVHPPAQRKLKPLPLDGRKVGKRVTN